MSAGFSEKRVNFLEESFELLGLEGIKAIHGRAEEYAKIKSIVRNMISVYPGSIKPCNSVRILSSLCKDRRNFHFL